MVGREVSEGRGGEEIRMGFVGSGTFVSTFPTSRRLPYCRHRVKFLASSGRVRMGLVVTREIEMSLPNLLLSADHLDVEHRQSLRRAYLYTRRNCSGNNDLLDRALAVSTIMAGMRSRVEAIIMAMVCQLDVSEEELDAIFGSQVVRLTRGAKKVRNLPLELDVGQNIPGQVEDMKGLLLTVVQDAEVLLYLLAEKLYVVKAMKNDETSHWERKRISTEIWDVYAPLAGLIGANRLKTELEDLGFYIYDAETYSELERQVRLQSLAFMSVYP